MHFYKNSGFSKTEGNRAILLVNSCLGRETLQGSSSGYCWSNPRCTVLRPRFSAPLRADLNVRATARKHGDTPSVKTVTWFPRFCTSSSVRFPGIRPLVPRTPLRVLCSHKLAPSVFRSLSLYSSMSSRRPIATIRVSYFYDCVREHGPMGIYHSDPSVSRANIS